MKLLIDPGESPGSHVERAVSSSMKALCEWGHLTGDFSRPEAVIVFGTGHRVDYSPPVFQYVLDGTEEPLECASVTVFQSAALKDTLNPCYMKRKAVIPCPVSAISSLTWEFGPGAPVICLAGGEGDGRETLLKALAGTGRGAEFFTACGGDTGAAACVYPSLLNRPPPGILMDIAASGVPVLASASRFIHDFLTDGINCLLHSPGNHIQLAGQLGHLLKNPGLARYLSGNAVEYCMTCLSPKSVGEMWNSLLEQVCLS